MKQFNSVSTDDIITEMDSNCCNNTCILSSRLSVKRGVLDKYTKLTEIFHHLVSYLHIACLCESTALEKADIRPVYAL